MRGRRDVTSALGKQTAAREVVRVRKIKISDPDPASKKDVLFDILTEGVVAEEKESKNEEKQRRHAEEAIRSLFEQKGVVPPKLGFAA